MKFVCPKCGMLDDVIGDENPLCLVCRTELIKATTEYTDLMMSPVFVIRRFETVIGKYGWVGATKGHVKKEREAWISAVWSFGIQRVTRRQHWIEIETRDQTPDCKVHVLDQSAGHNHRLTMNVEVVEWETHRSEMMGVISQKCARAYPNFYFLVVFVRNDKHTLVEDILNEIRSQKVPFAEIWILGRLPEGKANYRMFMAYPEPAKVVDFDLIESCRDNLGQRDVIHFEGRGKSIEMRDRGSVYIPIP